MRDTAFSVSGTFGGLLLRDERYAFIQHAEDASGGVELYDMGADPQQFANLASSGAHREIVEAYQEQLASRLEAARTNDLGLRYRKR